MRIEKSGALIRTSPRGHHDPQHPSRPAANVTSACRDGAPAPNVEQCVRVEPAAIDRALRLLRQRPKRFEVCWRW